ncbi:fungal-specific transcription factor domain-containing protein [Irpex rosettiformis]|uniref:Fungal-specific transcription factor domain-containing protein n=1 Tax=Irpex rosettiformis TaxID=378272 RepID=A0ACB8UDE6_9APHY|nr:fungal-specific transcription factor domain-containing protein [Irpex rosettiformis]
MPNGVCTNCITFKYKCTYVQSAPKRVPDSGYLESLETQMSEMRTLLNKYRALYPDAELSDDLNRIVSGSSPFAEQSSANGSPRPSAQPPSSIMSPLSPVTTIDMNDAEPELDPSDDEIKARNNLAKSFETLSIHHDNFLGKSSSMMFLQAALESKQDYVAGPANKSLQVDASGSGLSSLPGLELASSDKEKRKRKELEGSEIPTTVRKPQLLEFKRLEYWEEHPWVLDAMHEHYDFTFPPTDLMDDLISLYFSDYNIYTPLLHLPTFQRQLQEGLHLRDPGFGSVVLMVCALGSRSSDDPRVLLDTEESNARKRGDVPPEKTYYSAGWTWFEQVQKSRLAMSLLPSTLYDLQVCYLASIYGWGIQTPGMAWNSVGLGLRMAQSMGAHRKKSYGAVPTIDEELRKRAFWALLHLDRLHSSVLGRPCGIQDEDFDVDLPIACDDEYWLVSDPEKAFKQPPDKPSEVIFFNYLLRLSQIHAFALRTIYSINKSKALLGLVGHDWQQRILAEVDSALNQWIDSLPSHLRWDPHMENVVFLNQSACLYAAYYTVQIVVHRPFIPTSRKPSSLSFPSLAICTNAARSCVHVVDEAWARTRTVSHIHQQYALLSSGIVLLLNIWGNKKSSTSAESMREMQEVHKVMNIVKAMEPRWYSSGKIWDILFDLANVGDLPLPAQCPPGRHKRPREEPPNPISHEPSPVLGERQVAGSKRVQHYQQNQQQQQQQQNPDAQTPPTSAQPTFALPLYSQDLGRMPLHPFAECKTLPPGSVSACPQSPWGSATAAHPPQCYQPGSMHMCGQITDDSNMMRQPIDPALEALLSMLAPAQYQQAQMTDGSVGAIPPGRNGYTVQASPVNSTPPSRTVDPSDMTIDPTNLQQQQQQQPNSLTPETMDSDTFAMWSSAPSGFAFEDWGTYVNNFNALGVGNFGQQSSAS